MTKCFSISIACIIAGYMLYKVHGLSIIHDSTKNPALLKRIQPKCIDGRYHHETKESPSDVSRTLTRRDVLRSSGLSLISCLILPNPSRAETVDPIQPLRQQQQQKPFAPTSALLPILKLKLWLDEAFVVSTSMKKVTKPEEQRDEVYQLVLQMNDILTNPPKLFLKGEKIDKSSSSSVAANFGQLTGSISSVNKDQYQSNRQSLNMANKVAAMLNQADVERQWGMLQYAEQKRANDNEMRAAFNFYTSQLSFGDTYVLTANKDERKTMIRNDELPSLAAVITSDLDLRDLYRNQFLTAIEDLQAEVAYQVKLGGSANKQSDGNDEMDITDILEFMNTAHTAMENWFDMIEVGEVDAAKKVLFQ